MDIVPIDIPAGAPIKDTLLDALVEKGLSHAAVIGAIGSAVDLAVAAPVSRDLPPKTVEVPYGVACEVVAMSGEVMPWDEVDPRLLAAYPARKDPLFLHLHIAAAMAGGRVFGGGLRSGRALRHIRVFVIPQ